MAEPIFSEFSSLRSAIPEKLNDPAISRQNMTILTASIADAFQSGGDRLDALQNNDGGWDWPLDDGDPNNASPLNTVGPIAKGLAQIYNQTGDADHRTALSNAGVLLLTKTNNFSPSDGYLAWALDDIFGGTTYKDHLNTNFYGPLASGNYDKGGAGTLYSTQSYVQLIRDSRASQGIANLAAWDVAMGLVAAASCGVTGTELDYWIQGVKGEIDELDGSENYDVIGLAGAVYGLAFVGEDFDPTSGEHAAASDINDLADILASYQINGGGFAWNSEYVIPDDDNETIQETAYAILALAKVDHQGYFNKISGAGYYIRSVQLSTGGWENYTGSGENNEITGEGSWGMSESFPVYNVDKSTYHPTIQDGIDNADSGNELLLAEYTFNENHYAWVDIRIDRSLKIVGQGPTKTSIELTYKQNGIEIQGTNLTVTLEGVKLTRESGNTYSAQWPLKAGEGGSSLTLLTLKNVEIEHGEARNLHLDGGGTFTKVVIENCDIHHAKSWGFSVAGKTDKLTMTDTDIHDIGDASNDGIAFDITTPGPVKDVTLTNCSFNNNSNKGINLVKTTNLTAVGCVSSNNGGFSGGGFGVCLWEWASGSSGLSFENCEFLDNSLDGFLFGTEGSSTIDDVTITNCKIKGNSRHGVFFYHNYGGTASDVLVTKSDLSGNSDKGVAISGATFTVDGSGCWWGDTDPTDNFTGSVDYTPWLKYSTDTSTDVGFQPDLSYLYVDNNSPQTPPKGRIQEGVDMVSGSTVHLMPGTYTDPFNIEGKTNLILEGDNKTTVILQPTSVLPFNVGSYGSSRNTAIRVVSSTGIIIRNLTLDMNVVKANYVHGLLFWDSEGEVNNNIIKNLSLPDAGGGYAEIGGDYRAPGYSDASRAKIAITDNTFIDTGRLGVVTHEFVDATITGNTFYKTTADFGYAIEIGGPSTGTISGNTIYGFDTPAASDGSESAGIYIENCFTSSMSGITKQVLVEENEIYDCQYGFWIGNGYDDYAGDVDIRVILNDNNIHDNAQGAAWIQDEDKEHGSSVTVTGGGNSLLDNGDLGYYIYTTGDGDITVNLTGETIVGHDIGVKAEDAATGSSNSSYNLTIEHSSVCSNSVKGAESDGPMLNMKNNWWGAASGPYDNKSLPGTPNYNNPTGAGNAVSSYVEYDSWLSGNIIWDPDPATITSIGGTKTIAVKYLGGASAPLYGYDIEFSWNESIATAGAANVHQGDLFPAGTGLSTFLVNKSGNKITVNSSLLGDQAGKDGPGTMFTVTFTAAASGYTDLTFGTIQGRDKNNVDLTGIYGDDGRIIVDTSSPTVSVVIENTTLTYTDDFIKDGDDAKVTATITEDGMLTTADIKADMSPFGGGTEVNPDDLSNVGTTWTAVWDVCADVNDVVCNPANGTLTIEVTVEDMGGNIGTGSDDITSDNILPTKVTGLTSNCGHKKVNLAWTNISGTDLHPYGVIIRYRRWNDYPKYDATAPSYPSSATDGDGGVSADPITGVTTYIHAIVDRDIYYYTAFAIDMAGNIGTAADDDSRDRSTNYYLADLGKGYGAIPGDQGYDGYVNFDDLSFLSGLYWKTDTELSGTEFEANFGPTVANKTYAARHRLAIPDPNADNEVGFEDLMVLSMNYGQVAPKVNADGKGHVEDHFALELNGSLIKHEEKDELAVTIYLANDGRQVKGASVKLNYDAKCLALKRIEQGRLFGSGEKTSFFNSRSAEGWLQIDGSILGQETTIDYSGTLAIAHFDILDAKDAEIRFESYKLRDGANNPLSAQVADMSVEDVMLPEVFDMAQNYPNPFNPQTTIQYQLPEACHVEMVIYNTNGQQVKTLVNEIKEPGRYQVIWKGTDESERPVSSGMYYYRIKAGDFNKLLKMIYLK
ncbi:right-handed parallel beta-helix repeat-containing protein [candidate division KSB1 bacterium]|nr:right-handed parallel beta-helix repeat-containing protein [candidate division KSB1 bacterium]